VAHSKVAPRHLKAATHGSLKPTSSRAPVKSRLKGAIGSKESAPGGRVEPGYVRIKLGNVTVQAKALGIAAGRIALPKMIQGSMALEDAFLVRNVKNPTAPEVLVINPAALDQELRRVRPGRTLGDIVDVLPFNRQGVPSLRVRALPDAGIEKRLRLPVVAARSGQPGEAQAAGVSAQAKAREG
jgi:hypothetical protein